MSKRFYDFNLSDAADSGKFKNINTPELKHTFYTFYPKVFKFVSVFVADQQMAEKITENVMLDFWQNRNSFLIKGNTEYYLASKVLDCIKLMKKTS